MQTIGRDRESGPTRTYTVEDKRGNRESDEKSLSRLLFVRLIEDFLDSGAIALGKNNVLLTVQADYDSLRCQH